MGYCVKIDEEKSDLIHFRIRINLRKSQRVRILPECTVHCVQQVLLKCNSHAILIYTQCHQGKPMKHNTALRMLQFS